MIRTSLAKAYIKRTVRPLYGWTQSTPKSGFLDPAWDRSVQIWPGMVAVRTSADNYTLIGASGDPAGLFGHYIGGDGIDEPLDAGINAIAVWALASDAEFEVLAPAFDTTQTWTDPGNGTDVLVYAQTAGATRGKLVPAGTAGASSKPVARLVKVNSTSKITIAGLRGTF